MSLFEHAARHHASSRGSSGTRALYLANLAKWILFCELESIDPDHPNLAAATKFRDELAKKISPTTVRHVVLAISAMYNNAVDNEGRPVVSWNPFKRLQLPPAVKHGITETVPKKVAEAILGQTRKLQGMAIGDRDYALLELLYSTGVRVSTAVLLRRSDLFRRNGALLCRIQVKGGKRHEIELPAGTSAVLERWLALGGSSPFIFPSRDGRRPLTTKAVNKRLDVYAKAAGVGHVHPHQFRASFITELIESGVPLHEVQAAVHHEDPKTTLRYHRGLRGAGVTTTLEELRKHK